jgi:hypothetical protein
LRARIKFASPVPAASLIIFGKPLAESATAVATPVTNPVAMLCLFTAFRTDLRIALVVFLDIFMIINIGRKAFAGRSAVARGTRPLGQVRRD